MIKGVFLVLGIAVQSRCKSTKLTLLCKKTCLDTPKTFAVLLFTPRTRVVAHLFSLATRWAGLTSDQVLRFKFKPN